MPETAPQPILTREDEPASRVMDPEEAYWMGQSMVANMGMALQLRNEAANPSPGLIDSKDRTVFAGNPDIDRAQAIQYERAADTDGDRASQAFKTGDTDKLQELTKDGRLPHANVYVQPNNLEDFELQLKSDKSKSEKLAELHDQLFKQEGDQILAKSTPIRLEAIRIGGLFAANSKLEAGSENAKTMEQAARSTTSLFKLALNEFFNSNKIVELEKRGELSDEQSFINSQLRSIAVTGQFGTKKGGLFTPENLDIFNDPYDVDGALSYIVRNASGPQIIEIAKKSMRLLNVLQSDQSIMSPTGKDLSPLESRLKRIGDKLDTLKKPAIEDRPLERERVRTPVAPEERKSIESPRREPIPHTRQQIVEPARRRDERIDRPYNRDERSRER